MPIDPDAPIEKNRKILNDCDANVILGDEEYRNVFKGRKYYSVENISDDVECIDVDLSIEPDTPAYMVYTSGSTGNPKGVLKSHGAVISFIEAYTETFDFSNDEIIGNQTPFFFDASCKDYFLSVYLGATLEIIPTEKFAMPTELIEYLNEKEITFISWVPTALSIVAQLNTFSFIKPTTLKKVFFVGEVMPMKYLNKWRKALPKLEYVNLYGQSELSGICTYYRVKGEFENTDILPMGKALKNCNIYLVDNGKVVTEPEHIGEMYIQSPALALEYYNDKEKTEKSFLECDFGDGLIRSFKTGDLAKYDCDGNLVFASRNDFQIKHMGHRIELGEIETIANSLPEIARCCCLYNSVKSKIILFVELSDDKKDITGREILSKLKEKLSKYMVPSRVNILEKMPINANGKIDRNKLKEEYQVV